MTEQASLYSRLGAETGLQEFVQHLYQYMDTLEQAREIRAMHTLSLDEAGLRLYRFLSGMLGGPPLFLQHYGEPRLRRRHMHLKIGNAQRDAWMACARHAAAQMNWEQALQDELLQRLEDMASHLRNVPG